MFSMEPDEMRQLVIESERAWQALGQVSYGPTDVEKKSIQFRRSIYVVRDMKAGDIFTSENIPSKNTASESVKTEKPKPKSAINRPPAIDIFEVPDPYSRILTLPSPPVYTTLFSFADAAIPVTVVTPEAGAAAQRVFEAKPALDTARAFILLPS